MRFTLISATDVEDPSVVPGQVRLLGSYPNPFADEFRVAFEAVRAVRAHLEVFDMLGRSVLIRPWEAFTESMVVYR